LILYFCIGNVSLQRRLYPVQAVVPALSKFAEIRISGRLKNFRGHSAAMRVAWRA